MTPAYIQRVACIQCLASISTITSDPRPVFEARLVFKARLLFEEIQYLDILCLNSGLHNRFNECLGCSVA